MITKERALWIYTKMHEIRNFEERTYRLFEENKLRGSVHLYTGEEAIAATVCSTLTDNDYITSTHRGHGHCIAKGAELDKALAELMGKATGYCKGRSGSMHIADFTKGNLGANAIVGGGAPIATGAALAIKMQGRKNVAISFFGDGASNEGTIHESMNFASAYKLPMIFICENNGYAISVPVGQSTSVKDISVRAKAYDMPGYTGDGNDVIEIDKLFMKAKERAEKGEGPTLLEFKTARWRGHWTGDPQNYRPAGEVEEWKAKDPIKRFGDWMIEKGYATQAELDKIAQDAVDKMEAAVEFALTSPEPDPANVMDDVFFEG
ncbi:MAG: thiamine pyrophosphate-dependent dehydrogenase E1 component subunit alpha [Christensenellaceae bacterium]|nr:thiamine pyrophosphate-dependent dehydrogenase E1 component subunit alpha [Christensenellaceae bacterium]